MLSHQARLTPDVDALWLVVAHQAPPDSLLVAGVYQDGALLLPTVRLLLPRELDTVLLPLLGSVKWAWQLYPPQELE